jgi:hypothetical protein
MNAEELKELERQMGVKHLQYSEGHGAFWCSFVLEQLVPLEYGPGCECDYAAYDGEGFTCIECRAKEDKV